MTLSELFAIVDQVQRQYAELRELRRAVGPWPWRLAAIRASSAKPISETMTCILALVTFDGYELFPCNKPRDGRRANPEELARRVPER